MKYLAPLESVVRGEQDSTVNTKESQIDAMSGNQRNSDFLTIDSENKSSQAVDSENEISKLFRLMFHCAALNVYTEHPINSTTKAFKSRGECGERRCPS